MATDSVRFIILVCLAAATLYWAIRASSSVLHPLLNTCTCPPADAHRRTVNFTRREDFWDLSTKGDELWSNIIPDNGGFVFHRVHDKLGYKTGISMFHQLHCLQMIRMAIQKLQNGTVESGDMHSQTHWVHCLDYLVQGIQCAADGTSEPVKGHLVDGYDVAHQCRDARPLWELSESSFILD
ncbi:hypothetical protein LTR62_008711 [Meristemomyces frigidus]|uniref:Oxidase ustYa n=1 Tax=Meristemomyces frigidus TaxID=1508187 RepID=A0AAN7TAP8_9PEZI|nr:hypothetical protein LTR62_008711 [Meristemomyces frigidus]